MTKENEMNAIIEIKSSEPGKSAMAMTSFLRSVGYQAVTEGGYPRGEVRVGTVAGERLPEIIVRKS